MAGAFTIPCETAADVCRATGLAPAYVRSFFIEALAGRPVSVHWRSKMDRPDAEWRTRRLGVGGTAIGLRLCKWFGFPIDNCAAVLVRFERDSVARVDVEYFAIEERIKAAPWADWLSTG